MRCTHLPLQSTYILHSAPCTLHSLPAVRHACCRYVANELAKWSKNKKETYDRDLAARRHDVAEEEHARQRDLRQAQGAWRRQEKERLEEEVCVPVPSPRLTHASQCPPHTVHAPSHCTSPALFSPSSR